MGTINGHIEKLASMVNLPIPHIIKAFPTNGHIMTYFKHTLVELGPICGANCTVSFSKKYVTVFSPENKAILTGLHDPKGYKMWYFVLLPHTGLLPPKQANTQQASLLAYIAYDLSSVEALVRYLHVAAGFPFKSTWLAATKAGNFDIWPGLTYSNASKYYPESSETIKSHMVQTHKGSHSNKSKSSSPTAQARAIELDPLLLCIQTNEMHI